MTKLALAASQGARGANHESTLNIAVNHANHLGSLGHHKLAVDLLEQARMFPLPMIPLHWFGHMRECNDC